MADVKTNELLLIIDTSFSLIEIKEVKHGDTEFDQFQIEFDQ